MTFVTATGTLAALVDAIVNDMIGISGGNWVDADTGVTTAASPYGRVMKYNVSGEELYVAFMVAEYGLANSSYFSNGGILVFISSGWNTSTHIPTGTVQIMHLPAYTLQIASHSQSRVSAYNVQYWMWYENEILTLAWLTTTDSYWEGCGMFTMQRTSVSKEYADSATNFFFYTTAQKAYYSNNSGSPYAYGISPSGWTLPSAWSGFVNNSSYIIRKYAHPFLNALPTSGLSGSYNAHTYDDFEDGYDESRTMLIVPTRAKKSGGNAKVYMAFPVACADVDTQLLAPLATFKGFFPVKPSSGIADGDLINVPVSWEGGTAETWQYIYKSLTALNTGTLNIAIKYSEV